MITRAKAGVFKPKLYLTHRSHVSEPLTVTDALSQKEWCAAMNDEFKALISNKTWTLVPVPNDCPVIGCKWVFKVKTLPDGTIARRKARLVANGYSQTAGLDYHETFSPVVKPTTIRIILALAVSKGWTLQQLDVNNAFLNGNLTETIYMAQPPGFEQIRGDTNLVCRLNKALYGLKQAPRAWFHKLQSSLYQLGFIASKADASLFIKTTTTMVLYVLVYVDDIIVTGNNSCEIHTLIRTLNSQFALKHLRTLSYFLGIEASRYSGNLFLSQSKYAQDLLSRTKMDNAKPLPTPMATGIKLSAHSDEPFDDATLYRSTVGALQYLTFTRPDTAYSVNKVAQFMHRPCLSHWKTVKRTFRYINGTLQFGIMIKADAPFLLEGYCDADWGNDPDDRRSTSGFCWFLGGSPVSWSAKKQPLVSRSSTEAEFRSLANVTADLLWIKSLLHELGVSLKKSPVLWCDNLSTIALSLNPVMHSRTKHFELDLYLFERRFYLACFKFVMFHPLTKLLMY